MQSYSNHLVEVTTLIEKQDLVDLWTTALDSGISYWAESVDVIGVGGDENGAAKRPDVAEIRLGYEKAVKDVLDPAFRMKYVAPFASNMECWIVLSEDEVNGEKRFCITAEKLELALQRKEAARIVATLVKGGVPDAGDADVIVQLAAFGEVVFA